MLAKKKKMQENKKLLMIFAAVFDGDKIRPFAWVRARARATSPNGRSRLLLLSYVVYVLPSWKYFSL